MPALGLDRASAVPLHRQLYDALRQAILDGRLRPGARLPSTRALALELGSSRNTVLAAVEQLTDEGYLAGRVGAGTTVRGALPEVLLHARPGAGVPARSGEAAPRLSRRGALLVRARPGARPGAPARPFRPGAPAYDESVIRRWGQLTARHWGRVSRHLLDYGDPLGFVPLREAIATYLREARAVRCEAEQVMVVSGSQHGLDLATRLLLDPGDRAWIEDPGYLGARGALVAAGARVVPVPVDGEGLEIARALRAAPDARLAYVTPSHQYPLGVTMSLARRLALLDWARARRAWIVEDDYDSEYRYTGRPLASLQGLDRHGRVIYVGTFSKVLFPALRLGYVVVPPSLVDAFAAARGLVDRHPPSVTQAVLAEFIIEGSFARHVRRMRVRYAEQQAALVQAARRDLDGALEVAPTEAGMHLVGWLPSAADDRAMSAAALRAGVEAPPLSAFRLRRVGRGGLLLGYAAWSAEQLREAVTVLADALAARRAAPPAPPRVGRCYS
jgi:GntR family transcriptional regulator/MocR family aminotransferase